MRVGIVGAGTMGAVHAAAWRAIGAELVGCTSLHAGQREAFTREHGGRAFPDLAELLRSVDIVDVCAPTAAHKSIVLQAADAGKHITCEKPIALSIEDATEMIEACDRVRFFVGMVVRFFPQYRLARELIAKGELGRLGVIRLKRVSYPPQVLEDNWFVDEQRSGGMIVDLMIHDLDYAHWLAGDVERIYALRGRSGTGPAEYTQTTVRFKSGAMALIEGGWANPPGVIRTAIDISGSAGVIEWNSDQTPTVRTFFPQSATKTTAVGLPVGGLTEDPYTAELRHAYEAILFERPFEITATDAMESLRMALAVKESVNEKRPVFF
jgi:predicted dehydrogenase